jgi:hypothetical protein
MLAVGEVKKFHGLILIGTRLFVGQVQQKFGDFF